MSVPTTLLLNLVRQAAKRRRESDQDLRSAIVAARAGGLPLAPIAEAADLSVARIHAILEKEQAMTAAFAPSSQYGPEVTDDVVVVAARIAYDEYINYGAYVCQPGRSFRDVDRMGFYRHGNIEPHFPEIRTVEDDVPFTREEASRRRATGSPIDREIADLIDTLLDHHRRDELPHKVFLLTPPDDPRTLTLDHEIRHDSHGRGTAWTMGQRYIGEATLRRNPRTTDDL